MSGGGGLWSRRCGMVGFRLVGPPRRARRLAAVAWIGEQQGERVADLLAERDAGSPPARCPGLRDS